MEKDLALGLSKLYLKPLLCAPSKSKVLSLFYVVILHLHTEGSIKLLQQIQAGALEYLSLP